MIKNNFYSQLINQNKTYPTDMSLFKIFSLLDENINFAFARFNDGELMGIDKVGSVVARGDQLVNNSLSDALKKSISHQQKNYIIGVPCSSCYKKYNELALSLIKQDENHVINAVALTNRNWARFILDFPDKIKGKRVLWISGDDQNITTLIEDMGIDIVGQLKFSSKNTWDQYEDVKRRFNELDDKLYDIVMVSLGPTARIFVQEMFADKPNKTFIDIGSTYDPFTRNVWHNCHKGWLEKGFNNTNACKICN